MEEREYNQVLSVIDSLGKSGDLKGLERLADTIYSNWSEKNKEYYGQLMLNICNSFSSRDFGEGWRYDLELKYAELALEKSSELPLETVCELLRHLFYTDETVYSKGLIKGEEWSRQRSARTQLWLDAWKRLQEGIDDKWDPNDLPLINVSPPLEAGLPAGVAPEHIKDPKIRAEYEAAIAKNRQKAEKYNQQYKLRRLKEWFLPMAEEYIIGAYSRRPFNYSELKGYIEKYVAQKDRSMRILDGVSKAMSK